MKELVTDIIREELGKIGINVIKIILFGSRARRDFKTDSDWDLFVVVDRDLNFQERQNILVEIYRKLAKLEDSYEIILKSVSGFERMKDLIGCVSYDVDKEGVVIWKR